jgi:hypothetical protein
MAPRSGPPVIIIEFFQKRKAPRKAVDYPMNERPG